LDTWHKLLKFYFIFKIILFVPTWPLEKLVDLICCCKKKNATQEGGVELNAISESKDKKEGTVELNAISGNKDAGETKNSSWSSTTKKVIQEVTNGF
jgi:hypothetical protein